MDAQGKNPAGTVSNEVIFLPPYTQQVDRCGIASAGWGVMTSAGVIALIFLLCISLIPSKIFPVRRDLYANNIPLEPQGTLRIYPNFSDPFRTLLLPPKDLQDIVESIQGIIKEYPQDYSSPYVMCWLQNPSYNNPCFFDVNWVNGILNKYPNFGYTENNGTFSPCVLFRIEDTGMWDPIPFTPISPSEDSGLMFKEYDPGYARLDCRLKHSSDAPKLRRIQVFPEKGYPRLFFPQAAYNATQYLMPMVVVQAEGLRVRESVTIECTILVENGMYLENYGDLTIKFGSSEPDM